MQLLVFTTSYICVEIVFNWSDMLVMFEGLLFACMWCIQWIQSWCSWKDHHLLQKSQKFQLLRAPTCWWIPFEKHSVFIFTSALEELTSQLLLKLVIRDRKLFIIKYYEVDVLHGSNFHTSISASMSLWNVFTAHYSIIQSTFSMVKAKIFCKRLSHQRRKLLIMAFTTGFSLYHKKVDSQMNLRVIHSFSNLVHNAFTIYLWFFLEFSDFRSLNLGFWTASNIECQSVTSIMSCSKSFSL